MKRTPKYIIYCALSLLALSVLALALSFGIRIYGFDYDYDGVRHVFNVDRNSITEHPRLKFKHFSDDSALSNIAFQISWPARLIESLWKERKCDCGFNLLEMRRDCHRKAKALGASFDDVLEMSWVMGNSGFWYFLELKNGETLRYVSSDSWQDE